MEHRGRTWLLVMYVASAVATCVLVALMPGTITHRLVKAVPLLLLVTNRWLDRGGSSTNFVGLGLFASLIGDAAIDSNFVAGLGAFLIGHFFYILALGIPERKLTAWLAALPALVLACSIYWLFVGSGRTPVELRIPVTIYIFVISSMFGRALARAFVEKKNAESKIFLLGAFFFVVSDTLIGIRRWVYAFPLVSVAIMATYYAAQWFIYCGSARRR